MKSMETDSFITALRKIIQNQELLLDNAKQFRSCKFLHFRKMEGIKKIFTYSYNLQGNPVERVMQNLSDKFRLSLNDPEKEIWSSKLGWVGRTDCIYYCLFVFRMVKRYNETGNIVDKLREGRPHSVHLPYVIHIVCECVRWNPLHKQKRVAQEMSVSTWTMSCILYDDLKLGAQTLH